MSASDAPGIRRLGKLLKRFVACVIDKAHEDPEFASRLGQLLLGSAEASAPSPPKSKRRHGFNPVDILHREGRDRLQEELQLKTDSELKDILRAEGMKGRRTGKQIDRTAVIREIIQQADRRLHQGKSFL